MRFDAALRSHLVSSGFSEGHAELWASFVEHTIEMLEDAATELKKPENWQQFVEKKGALGKARKLRKNSETEHQIPIEDALTSELGHIIRRKRRSLPLGHFLRLHEVTFDFEALVESNYVAGRHSKKVDFLIYGSLGENSPELALEAKPLASKNDIEARYLAQEGIGCFISTPEPYTEAPCGGMLAYKVDGTKSNYVGDIRSRVEVMTPAPSEVSELLAGRRSGEYFFSRHCRVQPQDSPITLVHLEISFDPVDL